MPPIRIRRANHDDLAAVVAGNINMAQETEGLSLDQARVSAGVGHLIEHPELGHYWLAFCGQTFAGQCMITTEWSDWRNQPMWWFQSVYVVPNLRRRGVFSALYQHVATEAQTQGVRDLRLYVERQNQSAQATYRQLGMQHSHYDMFETVLRSED